MAGPSAVDIASLGVGSKNETSFIRSDLYEERQTPESGIGAFATALITSGTRIFCEESLIVLPDNAGHLELHRAVKALPDEKQAAYWNLAASSKPCKNVDWIDTLRACCDDDSSDTFNSLVEEHELAMSIYETNRFTMRFSDRPKSLGIFPMSARLNHSCAPNVFHRYNPLINRLTVYALRDIQPDEELLTSYIDICHPTIARRQVLNHWGFQCQCTACSSTDDDEDHRRKKLAELLTKIGNRERKRARNEAKWSEKDYQRTMDIVGKAIRLLEKEGMEETDTLGVVYTLAVKLAVNIGREDDAVKWAEKVVAIEKKCLGEDSNEYHSAVDLLSFANKARTS